MSRITKKQHNVPVFYLRQWVKEGSENVVCHDLHSSTAFDVSPEGILARRYYYEENEEAPDNMNRPGFPGGHLV
jgi:hypothetical protein